jgi:hypothetical protein
VDDTEDRNAVLDERDVHRVLTAREHGVVRLVPHRSVAFAFDPEGARINLRPFLGDSRKVFSELPVATVSCSGRSRRAPAHGV